jgi:hypothetical protein
MSGVRVVVAVVLAAIAVPIVMAVFMPGAVSAMGTMRQITRPTGRSTLNRIDMSAH